MTLPTPKQVAHEYWHRQKTETVLLEDAILADRERLQTAYIEAVKNSRLSGLNKTIACVAIRSIDITGGKP